MQFGTDSLDWMDSSPMFCSFFFISFFASGLLCAPVLVGPLFRSCHVCGSSHAGHQTAKICSEFYLWFHHLYGELCHYEGPVRTLSKHVHHGTTALYHDISGKHILDIVSDVFQGRTQGIHLCSDSLRYATCRPVVVSH